MKPRKIYWPATSAEEEAPRMSSSPAPWRPFGILLSASMVLLLSGCGAPYLIQQGIGQLDITMNRVELGDPDIIAALDASQLEKLSWIPRILRFSEEELGLKPGDSYTSYFDTRGDPVSYTVVASHPLGLVPYQWCFPLVGCVPYKGFFHLEDAREAARVLRESGWDAEVLPVQAYSTLGWFSDPLLSNMLDLSMPELVELLIHEITHQTLFIPSRGQLNEGFATHMGREGVRLFFLAHPEAARKAELEEYHQERKRDNQYRELISRLKTDLEALYRGPALEEKKLERKRELFNTATRAARELFQSDTITLASNARVVASETYTAQLALLERLQKKTGGHPGELLLALKEASENGSLDELLAVDSK